MMKTKTVYERISEGQLRSLKEYKKGYWLLMEYWDSLPDEVQEELHEELIKLDI